MGCGGGFQPYLAAPKSRGALPRVVRVAAAGPHCGAKWRQGAIRAQARGSRTSRKKQLSGSGRHALATHQDQQHGAQDRCCVCHVQCEGIPKGCNRPNPELRYALHRLRAGFRPPKAVQDDQLQADAAEGWSPRLGPTRPLQTRGQCPPHAPGWSAYLARPVPLLRQTR